MRILVIGATGTIGKAVVDALKRGNEIIEASRKTAKEKVDVTDVGSLRALFGRVGKIDAIVSLSGGAAWKPLAELTDEDFAFSLRNKLMGQVNVLRYGIEHVNDRGSITLTSGILGSKPQAGGSAVSLVNCALDGFARAAALEAPRGIRVNSVSPPWVSETLAQMKMDPKNGMPAAQVAKAYVRSVTGSENGNVIEP